MAQFATISLLIIFQYFIVVYCRLEDDIVPSSESNLDELTQFIVDSFNDEFGSENKLLYHSASIINAHHGQNTSGDLSLVQLRVWTACQSNASSDCGPGELVCEVLVRDDNAAGARTVLHNQTVCAPPPAEPSLPPGGQGWTEQDPSDPGERALSAIQQLQSEPGLNVVEVMAVKEQVSESGSLLFLTLRATRTDGSDASQLEVCEVEVNGTEVGKAACFPISGLGPNTPLNGEHLARVAEEAADRLGEMAGGRFNTRLVDITKADKIVTPGSEGTLTSLELRLSPTLCLHRPSEPELGSSLLEDRHCVDSEPRRVVVCQVARWDRPWKQDTLYSDPACRMEEPIEEAETTETDLPQEELEMTTVDTPVTEESPLPHLEITVQETKVPVVEETRVPVVEEPFTVKHVFCSGCPTDLNVDNPALQEYVEQALGELDNDPLARHKHALVRIAKAQRQVINGVKYTLFLEVTESSCPKNSMESRSSCQVVTGSPVQMCMFEYQERPWLHAGREIVANNCSLHDRNDLDNEIEPHFLRRDFADQPGVFDYLDAMDAMDEPFLERREPSFPDHDTHFPEADEEEVGAGSIDNKSSVDDSESSELGGEPRVRLEHGGTDMSSEESTESQDGGPFRRRRDTKGKTPLLGGLKEIDASEKDLIDKLSRKAVDTLDDIDDDDMKRVVLKVLDAKKQLANGVLYHIKLRVGFTSCPENTDKTPTPGCLDNVIGPIKICEVQLHQSFAGASPNDVQVVKAECTNEIKGPKKRQRREVSVNSQTRRGLVGGYHDADVNGSYIKNVTLFALSTLDGNFDSPNHQKLIRIESASTQVVAGTNVRVKFVIGPSDCPKASSGGNSSDSENISSSDNTDTECSLQEGGIQQVCSVVVWHQLSGEKTVTSFSCERVVDSEGEAHSRSKRHSGHLVGAPAESDVNDEYIREIADFALSELDRTSDALYSQKIVNIYSAQKQVVAGTLVKLRLEVGLSSCLKGHSNNLSSCELQDNSNNRVCNVQVWDKPWLKQRTLHESSCESSKSRSKRSSKLLRKGKLHKIGGGTHDINLGLFRDFLTQHGKQYQNKSEFKRRYHIFRANMKKIQLLQETERGTGKYGPTQFTDLTAKEFRSQYLGLNPKLREENSIPLPLAKIPEVTLPDEFDWRHYNVVTEVKNQGVCGSCWAFSVTGNIEGQLALRSGQLVSLSEQELVDCDSLDEGCSGGLPENAYKAIEELGGLESESDYPYEGENEKCHFNKSEVRVKVQGGLNITSNETQMAQWLVKHGPISIGINANAMQFYMGGVSHPWKFLCSPDDLDHGVLIVGYGVHTYPLFNKTLPFWTIKNSWGDSWGEQGYYRVYRGDGTCGVNQMATSAILA